MVFDLFKKGAKKAGKKAKEVDESLVEAHSRDAGSEGGGGIFGGGGRGSRSGGRGGAVLRIEYRDSTDEWVVRNENGHPLSTYNSKDAALAEARSRVRGNGKFTDYSVTGGNSTGPQSLF